MAKEKILAKAVELGIGTTYLGKSQTLSATRGTELEVTPIGVIAKSGKNQRRVLIPWSNVRAVELEKETSAVPPAKKQEIEDKQ